MKVLAFILFSLAIYGQREEVSIGISIDGPTRTLLNQKRARMAHPSAPTRNVLANITATDVTIVVGDGALPVVPFQAAVGSGDTREIVRVTAATRRAVVGPQSANPATYELTVERGRSGTLAAPIRAGEAFVPLRYDSLVRMLKQEVLVPWIIRSYEDSYRVVKEAEVSAVVAAAQREAVQ